MKSKIVVSLLNDSQSYQRRQAEEARAAAARADLDLELLVAQGNLNTQIRDLMRHIGVPAKARPAAMVVEPVTADGLEIVGRRAAQAGIGWIVLHSSPPYIEFLSREFPRLPIAQVVADNRQTGAVQARQFRALLPNGGQIVYIEGPGASATTIDRRRAMEDGIRTSSIRVAKVIGADWTEGGAERGLEPWLRTKVSFRPDLIGCQNDSMAIGALRAIQAANPGWGKVVLTGVDGLPEEGQRLVKEGVLRATIIAPNTAGKGVELVARSLNGEPVSSLTLPVESFPGIEELASVPR